ncbi:MAG: hypothetical protein SFU98_17935 [Leptospiraceae bacterium]|nr:hypothetical protein [Leptospiraceae bacterium]
MLNKIFWKSKNFFVLCIVITLINCITVHDLSLTNTKESKSEVNPIHLVIKDVKITDYDDDEKTLYESYFKSNLKNSFEKSKSFHSVEFYKKGKQYINSRIIDIELIDYKNKVYIHPLYFPLSILTLTIYIWVGGPVITYKQNYKIKIDVYNEKLNKLNSTSNDFSFSKNQNIYNSQDRTEEVIHNRFKFVLESIQKGL